MSGSEKSKRSRPALWAVLSFSTGLVVADMAEVPVPHLSGLVLSLFAAALALFMAGERLSAALNPVLLVLVAGLGALRYEINTELLPGDHIAGAGLDGRKGVFKGRVATEPERRGQRLSFVLDVEEAETDSAIYRVSGRILVSARGLYVGADYGDRVTLLGRLRLPSGARNPGAFDYRRFLFLQNMHATLSLSRSAQIVAVEEGGGSWLWEGVVLPIRRSVRQSIRRNLDGAPADLLQGMLLGDKHRISAQVRDSFRRTGLAHALVISGLHVGLVAVFFFTAFKLCRFPDGLTSAATVMVLGLYALVTEMEPPVVRASIMASVILVGRMAGRPGDIYNSLGLAALVILVAWPTSLFSLGFQLSFGATLAIVGLHSPIARLFPSSWRRDDRMSNWVMGPLCVSLAAQIGTGPLIAYHFQHFALISLAANVIVAPLLGLVVSLGLLTALSGWWAPLAATAFNASNYVVLKGLIALVEGLSSLPFASVTTYRPGIFFLLAAFILALLLARMPGSLRARKWGIFVPLVWANVALWSHLLRADHLEMVFLDVGQGDGAFIRFPEGRTMVVDGGNRSEGFDYGARVLLPFLNHRGVERIDVVVASHPHSDHIGGLVTLLEEVEVGHYLDSGQHYDSWTARKLRSLLREKGIGYHRVAAGDTLVGLGGVGALVLHPRERFVTPGGESPYDLNNGSVVLALSYGKVRVLFTGDVEKETDSSLLAWGERLQASVLKVPHHGSSTSSLPPLVQAVKPEIAVVSVGAFNRFRHPSPVVLRRLEAGGARTYRTDRCGAVIVETDGETLKVGTML